MKKFKLFGACALLLGASPGLMGQACNIASSTNFFCTGANLTASIPSCSGTDVYSWEGPTCSPCTTQTITNVQPGIYSVTISGTSGDCCSASVEINAPTTVTCPAMQSTCVNSPTINLNNLPGTSPSGGVFSGPGVSNNIFNPANAGSPGNKTITYTFTNSDICPSTCSFIIDVNALPTMNCPNNQSTCITTPSINLANLGATPAGGTFSGTGVLSNMFLPNLAGAGVHTITYTFTNSDGCTNSCTFNFTVTNVPVLNCPADLTVCAGAAPINLTTLGATPAGGTFSGPGVTNNIFNANNAGGVGVKVITYTVVSNGCTGSCNFDITVASNPTVTCPATQQICVNAASLNLATLGASPAGGTFTGTGVVGNVFNPATAGTGTKTITYTLTANGCSGSCTFSIVVNAVPAMSCPSQQSTCVNASAINLANTLNESPTGGTFSGTGVSNNIFTPSSAGVGTHTINYSFTNTSGCTGSCTFNYVVNPQPTVLCPQTQTVCINSPSLNLNNLGATPSGGTFTGTGVSGSTFSPNNAGVGTHQITYTVSVNNCSNQCTFFIQVITLPTMDCPSNQTACINDPSINLNTLGALPAGGDFSGPGVVNNFFSPANAGVGSHTITYVFANSTSCSNSCTFVYTVSSLPVMACPSNFAVCGSSASVDLTALSATPSGGVFSGPGVSGGMFSPALAGVGVHNINYSATNSSGCDNFCVFNITVNPLPNATLFVTETSGTGLDNNDGNVCEGGDFILTPATTDFQCAWSSTDQSITPPGNCSWAVSNISLSADFSVTVTNPSTQCTSTGGPLPITVFNDPGLEFAIVDPCIGLELRLVPMPSNFIEYAWSRASTIAQLPGTPLGTTPTLIIPNAQEADDGFYRLRVEDGAGCEWIFIDEVDVKEIPHPELDETYLEVCQEQLAFYRVVNPTDREGDFIWEIQPPFTGIKQEGELLWVKWGNNTPDTYTIKVTESLGTQCMGTDQITVHISDAIAPDTFPIELLKVNDIMVSGDNAADCYQWGFFNPTLGIGNDDIMVEIPGQVFQAYAPGAIDNENDPPYNEDFTYWVKTWNGDCSSPTCATISISFRTTEADSLPQPPPTEKRKFLLYPNPNDGSFKLEVNQLPALQYTLLLVDAWGRTVERRMVATPDGEMNETFVLGEVANGFYTAVLLDGKGVYRARKFLVSR